MMPIVRRVARECGMFALFALLAVLMTWPLARSLDSAVSDLGDPLLNAWILDWTGQALVQSPLRLFDAPVAFPARLTLALSEHLAGVALLVIPFQLAGAGPITVYNLAMLIGFTLAGYGGFVLCREVTGSTLASISGGIIFAFVPHKFDHLSHLQIVCSGWIPLLLAALLAYWKRPGRGTAAWLAVAFLMNGLTNLHYLLFGALTVGVTVVLLAIVEPRRTRTFWATLTAALFTGGLLLVPFVLPYRAISRDYSSVRGVEEVTFYSGTPSHWLAATMRNDRYGALGPPELQKHELQLFPGLAAILLALAALIWWRPERPGAPVEFSPPPVPRRKSLLLLDGAIAATAILAWIGVITDRTRLSVAGTTLMAFDSAEVLSMMLLILTGTRLTLRYPEALGGKDGLSLRGAALRSRFPSGAWAASGWIAIGFLGSLGMHAFFHAFLYRRIPMFQGIRAVGRWSIIAYPGLAVWAAMGVAALMAFASGWKRSLVGVLLAGVVLSDLDTSIRWEHVVQEPPAVHRWLARERLAPYVEIPLREASYQYDLSRTAHQLPTINGPAGWDGGLSFSIAQEFAGGNGDKALQLLEQSGCRIAIVHSHLQLPATSPFRDWLARAVAGGRLAALQTFDHDTGEDFVFAITRNLPGWQRYREPELPDGAGHLLPERLRRVLAGETVYNEMLRAQLEAPVWGATVAGPLEVRGWALSPFPIRRISVLVAGGTVRFDDVARHSRPDLPGRTFYPFVSEPGFSLTLPSRPAGVPLHTDVRVEIEDEGGRITHTLVVPFRWDLAP